VKQHKLGWKAIHHACSHLAEAIKKDIEVDTIIAVARGGLIPASILNLYLKPESMYVFGVSSYKDTERQNNITCYQQLPPKFPTIYNRTILVVDDLVDSGRTFNYTKQELKYLKQHCPSSNARRLKRRIYTAAPYIKDHVKDKPDYYTTTFPEDAWLVFPWD